MAAIALGPQLARLCAAFKHTLHSE